MKKAKLFFAAAALCLITIGVFAGKKTFSEIDVYYTFNHSDYYKIAGNPDGTLLNTSSGTVATISTSSSPAELYTYDGAGGYTQLFTSF